MRSCEKAATLLSEQIDRRLTPGEWIGLAIHRALCGPCRTYRRQLLTLRERASALRDAPPADATMQDDVKSRIRDRLRNAAKPED